MNKIHKYAKKSVNKLDLTIKEKKELEIQFIDHMTELYDNHKSDGFSDEDSIKYAINMFNESNEIKVKNNNPFYKWVYFLFAILCILLVLTFVAALRTEFTKRLVIYKGSFIPFNHILAIIFEEHKYKDWYYFYTLKVRLVFFSEFILLGILIPIITEKYRAFMPNLKKFIFVVLGFEIIKLIISKGLISIDFVIFHLLGCLIGYKILTIIRRSKKYV